MQNIFILGVKINNLVLFEAQQKVRAFLSSSGQYKIFTPNPEMLVKAQKDEYFKYSLNQGDLNLCDGRGIQFVSKQKIERIPGIDFMLEVCKIAEELDRSVYLLGSGNNEVIKKTVESLQKQFKKLKIVGWDKGPEIHENIKTLKHKNNVTMKQYNNETKLLINESENAKIINEINIKQPAILFVAFGMGKQEKWILENLPKIPSVKIAMVVGGAFDFISGAIKRAPLLMRKLGLEWLYRLIKQPKRLVRIFNATIIFVWFTISSKFKSLS